MNMMPMRWKRYYKNISYYDILRVSERKYEEYELTQEENDGGVVESNTLNKREIHVLVNKVQKDLEESFNPIKDLIYDIQLLKLWELHKRLTANDIKVFGIKTDCMLVTEAKEEIKINFSKDIGGVKYETKKKPINKK